MKIAISGASGTGKTTLARALAEYYQIPLNPIGARDVARDMGFASPYEVDQAGKRVEFQERLFIAKRAWEIEHAGGFVTDRSYLDNLTYCALHMAEHVDQPMVQEFMKAMGKYDAVLILPCAVFIQLDDGIRITNPMYHVLYELMLQQLFAMEQRLADKVLFRVPIESSTAAQRVTEAIAQIDAIMKQTAEDITP